MPFLHQAWLKEVTCDQMVDTIHINDKGMRFQPKVGQNRLQECLDNLEVFKPTGWLDLTPGY